MTLRQYIHRLILSPLVFVAASLLSLAMVLFPWWLVVVMHFLMFCYELFRLPFTALGIETPEGDMPLIQPFKSNLANNFVGMFTPVFMPFYFTYLFITEVNFLKK